MLKLLLFNVRIISVFIQQRFRKDCTVDMEMEISAPAWSHLVNIEAAPVA